MASDRTLNKLVNTVADQSRHIQALTVRLIEAREQLSQYEHPDVRLFRSIEAAICLLNAGTNVVAIVRALKAINGGTLKDAVMAVNAAKGILRVNTADDPSADLVEAMS